MIIRNTNLWILTEEKPKKSVIQTILKEYSVKNNRHLEINYEFYKINPIINENNFSFDYVIEGVTLEKINQIKLKITRGNSSFLDFLLIEQDEEPADGSCDNVIMGFEETKTNDDESRNTGIYQRAIKFMYAKEFSPKIENYMLYNDSLNSRENKKPSDTNIFGTNMLLTLGVNILGKKNMTWYKKFESIDELILAKSKMKLPPPKNVPILITKEGNTIKISGRLVKNGTLSHDPNIGALSTISMCLRNLGWQGDINITRHGITQQYITKTKGKNKFLYVCKLYNMKLEDIIIPNNYMLPNNYWRYEKSSEKVTSILLHILAENNGIKEVYQNHAGCERGYFITKENKYIALPKKDLSGNANLFIPDLILYDNISNIMLLIEAKKKSTMKQGLEELLHYDSIENEFINKHYPNVDNIRYITLFGGNDDSVPNDKTLVQINFDGSILVNENAPDFIKDLFE